jgi:hypothetical protein
MVCHLCLGDADETGVPAIKKAIVALVGGFGIQANNLW